MAKPAIRKGIDLTRGHNGYPPVVATSGSSCVMVDGKPAVRKGDAFKPHKKRKKPMHVGKAIGGGNVYIDGRKAQRKGDKLTCGDVSAGGSSCVGFS